MIVPSSTSFPTHPIHRSLASASYQRLARRRDDYPRRSGQAAIPPPILTPAYFPALPLASQRSVAPIQPSAVHLQPSPQPPALQLAHLRDGVRLCLSYLCSFFAHYYHLGRICRQQLDPCSLATPAPSSPNTKRQRRQLWRSHWYHAPPLQWRSCRPPCPRYVIRRHLHGSFSRIWFPGRHFWRSLSWVPSTDHLGVAPCSYSWHLQV